MAFTEAQNVRIRQYLGYPAVLRYANPRLENAMSVVGSLPDSQNMAELILTRLDAIMGVNPGDPGSIDETISLLGISKIEDFGQSKIEYGSSTTSKNGNSSSAIMNDLFAYANMLVNQLSLLFGVPIASRVFGTRGYLGDNWRETNNMSTGYGYFANTSPFSVF